MKSGTSLPWPCSQKAACPCKLWKETTGLKSVVMSNINTMRSSPCRLET